MASQYRVTFHYMYIGYQYVENTIWQTDSFDSLDYSFNANDVTQATLVLHPNESVPPSISSRNISMRIWRKPDGQDSYQLEGGTEWLVMRVQKSIRPENEGGTVYTITAYHPLIAFQRRVVAYKADTLYADKIDYPSIMMSAYAADNLSTPKNFDGSNDNDRQLGYTSKVIPEENEYVYLQSSKTLTRTFKTPSVGIYSAKVSREFALLATASNRVLKLARNFTVPEITDKIYFQGTSPMFNDGDFITLDDSTVGFLSNKNTESSETKFDFTRVVGTENTTFQTGHEAELDSFHVYLEGGALFFAENDVIRFANPSTVMNLFSAVTIGSSPVNIFLQTNKKYFRDGDQVAIGSGTNQVVGTITNYIDNVSNQRWTFTRVSGATGQTYAIGTIVQNPYQIIGTATITRGTPISYTVMNLLSSVTIWPGTTNIFLRTDRKYFRDGDEVTIGSGENQVVGTISNYVDTGSDQRWTFTWVSGATGQTYDAGTDVRNNMNNGREQRWMFTRITLSTSSSVIPENYDAENTKYDIYVSLASGDPENQKFNSGDFIRLRILNIFPYPGYKEVWGQVTNPYTVSSSEQRWTFSLVSGQVDTVFKYTDTDENTVWNFGTKLLPSVSGSWQNLLRVMQDLAAEEDKVGNRTYFQFRAYAGNNSFEIRKNYLNNDRRKEIQFSLQQGNLSEVTATFDYEKEVNFVYAGGSGSGAAQAVEPVASETLQKGTSFFRSEEYQTFADLDGDLLREEGRRFLTANRAKLVLRARVQDIPTCAYGVHYTHGDMVSVLTEDGVYDCHVYAVSVSVRNNEEDVEIYLDAQINI